MAVIKEIDLTESQTTEIQMLFARLTAIKNLVKEFTPSDNQQSFDLLLEQLGATQLKYDLWFARIQSEYSIQTTAENRWNVDFQNKKLQLLG